jgi:hypothetical protein
MPNASSKMNVPPRPPNVINTTQLRETPPLDREGADSQVDTNSLNTDFSIDKIEKDNDPTSPRTPTAALISDKLHRHTVIDWLWSESWHEILPREGERTLVWQLTDLDLSGQNRRPLSEAVPLQEMVNTSPEGHSKERFSTTPVTQSTSKEIALASEIEAMLGTPDDVSLWCSFTFTKLSSPPLTLPGKLFNDKTNGRVKADSVTVSLELVSFFCVLIKDDWV